MPQTPRPERNPVLACRAPESVRDTERSSAQTSKSIGKKQTSHNSAPAHEAKPSNLRPSVDPESWRRQTTRNSRISTERAPPSHDERSTLYAPFASALLPADTRISKRSQSFRTSSSERQPAADAGLNSLSRHPQNPPSGPRRSKPSPESERC